MFLGNYNIIFYENLRPYFIIFSMSGCIYVFIQNSVVEYSIPPQGGHKQMQSISKGFNFKKSQRIKSIFSLTS